MLDVLLGAGEQVVGAEHFVTLRQQPVDQMGAEKSRSAGDQNPPAPCDRLHLDDITRALCHDGTGSNDANCAPCRVYGEPSHFVSNPPIANVIQMVV